MQSLREVTAPAGSRLVVVYQFGKVGSTALVNALNRMPGVEAVQSHFLGLRSLREILATLLEPGENAYFHHHRLGQFTANLEITRRIEAVRKGVDRDTTLTVISVLRDPTDWFRSCLVQDIDGYMPALARFAQHRLLPHADEDTLIRQALPRVLELVASALEDLGGIDAYLDAGKPRSSCFIEPGGQVSADLRGLLSVFLRPFCWLDEHLFAYLKLSLRDFRPGSHGMMRARPGWGDVYLLQYERLEEQATEAFAEAGLGIPDLRQENRSSVKPHAGAIAASFETPGGQRLATLARDSRFARNFGYSD